MNIKALLSTAADVAEKVLPLLPIGGEALAAFKLANQVAAGIVAAEPVAKDLYEQITAAAQGGKPVSGEQWAEWEARSDKAHADLQAALAQ